MNKYLLATLSIVGMLAIDLPALSKPARQISPCDHVSFMILPNRKCLNLSHLTVSSAIEINTDKPKQGTTTTPQNPLINQFKLALSKIKVQVKDTVCESGENEVLKGIYNSKNNTITMCKNNLSDSETYLETLVHESWHSVQDCLDGMNNSTTRTLMASRPKELQKIVNSTSPQQWKSLKETWDSVKGLYPVDKRDEELEARFMQNHPREVLKYINMCARR